MSFFICNVDMLQVSSYSSSKYYINLDYDVVHDLRLM